MDAILRRGGFVMFPDTDFTAEEEHRFLEFNGGDWFMMLGGVTFAGLLVWLI
jgi:hypothetical protein